LGKFIDLTGQRFGRLVVKNFNCIKKGRTFWNCECDCGNKKIANSDSLKNGDIKSCGCLRKDNRHNYMKDLTDQRFGRLIVLSLHHKHEKRGAYWLCQCDCGSNPKIIWGGSLRNGTTKSCGCLAREVCSDLGKAGKGVSRPSTKLPFSHAMMNRCFNNYKGAAKKRNLIFELDIDFFNKITKQNCDYCGSEPSQIIRSKNESGDYIYNGIDRIDSSKGYTEDNVVSCCGRCNEAKMSESQQDFLDWHKKSITHQSKSWTDEQFEEFINQMKEARIKIENN
jgi:hypothetical protein